MAYQLSEKNQILIALFAIVIVCSGKLFKDYLYRRGYVEGLDATSTSSSTGTATSTPSSTGTSSITEIQSAIASINNRLSATGTNAPSREEQAELLKARSALVSLLASTYGTIQEAGQVFQSDALYKAQKTAIDFIAKEKERAKSNATALKQDNANKRRMAQVNTYYTRNYEANTEVMKNIIHISVGLIILAVLRNKEWIPASISTLGVIFVLVMGGIVVGKQVFDIMRRNDHDFDKYDWNFNEDEMNNRKLVQQNSDPANLSEMGIGNAPCYGSSCCDIGTVWDETSRKCIPEVGRIGGTATWSPSDRTLVVALKIAAGVTSGDSISMKLPAGLFTGSPALSGSGYTGAPSTSGEFALTVGATSSTVPNIVITGMSLSSSASSSEKILKVKTSKDQNYSGITVTGV